MEYDTAFDGEPSSGREKILLAVYHVIKSEGYDGISIQRIADEAGLSKATVYHHFDNKSELMLSFYEFASEEFGKRITQLSISDPVKRLYATVDRFVLGRVPDDAVDRFPTIDSNELGEEDPLRALIEVRAQGVHEEAYRERISALDRSIRNELVTSISDGIEQEKIRDVDPERTAGSLYTLLLGGLLQRATTDDADLEAVRDDAYEFIDRLLVE
ncbi:TetR/AcrR family transcriptional regulator [Haladaptatus sp.]|uniref:TetR/AcrR family transcriptional regulator n=1 Tax=Haladaptatus sp. TaxID=1973141 RepID=UPI003C57EB89